MTAHPLQWLAFLLYAGVGLKYWRDAARPAVPRCPVSRHWFVLAPLAAHLAAILADAFPAAGFSLSLGNTLSLITWTAIATFWLGNLKGELEGVQAIGYPLTALMVLMPQVLPGRHLVTHLDTPLLRAHLVAALVACGLLLLATLHALLMTAVDGRLRAGDLPPLLRRLPPLLAMERLLFRLVTAGFALLTLTLASGMFFAEELFGHPLAFTHKTVFAIASWLMFAVLLAGRHLRGWRGRLAARFTLGGFALLLLAYVGTRFVLEVILGR